MMADIYNYLFIELSNPLTREWLLTSSPFPLMLIIFGYLYFVLYMGPRIMKDRPPYKLKTCISLYNVIQIFSNLWFAVKLVLIGWILKFNVICPQPLMRNSPILLENYHYMWWIVLLKIFDLVETCIFVLRKKQNQVSTLHVYHHVSNLFLLWIYIKYVFDERLCFTTLINCIVHVIMYMYYFISAKSPKYRQIIAPYKHLLTIIQMVQFLVIVVYTLQLFHPACSTQFGFFKERVFLNIFIANVLIFLYLFYDFYKKTYTNVSKEKNI